MGNRHAKQGGYIIKALSIRDPYATQIAAGKKRIENRSWGSNIRGQIALHRCGKNGELLGVMNISDVISWEDALERYPEQDEFIGGPLCWVIDSFTPCPPVPCKGRLSLWECPDIEPLETPAWQALPQA